MSHIRTGVTNTYLDVDANRTIISYVTNNNLSYLKTALNYKRSDEINSIVDAYGNTLLHLATMSKNVPIIKFLLDKGMNKHRLNDFRETPWEMAVKTHDQILIQAFIDVELNAVETLRGEIRRIKDIENENKSLLTINKDLQRANDDLTNKYNMVLRDNKSNNTEVTMLKQQNKRLRDDNDLLIKENNELTESNKKLKIAVDNLMKANKK